MRKKKLFCALLLTLTIAIYAQVPQDTILYEGKNIDDIPKYIINDGIYYKWQWNKRNKVYFLYKDTLQLSINIPDIYMESFFMDKNNNTFYFGGDKTCCIFYFSNDSLSVIMLPEYCNGLINSKLYLSDGADGFYIRNMPNQELVDSFHIWNKIPGYLILNVIKIPNTSNTFFIFGKYDGGEISEEQYYIYDETNKKLTLASNSDILKNAINPYGTKLNFYALNGEYVFLSEYILDKQYSIFSKVNYFFANIYGFVLANREIKQLILKSILDSEDGKTEGNKVLIPFIPNPFREKALYEIYENMELKAEDLKQLDTFDLRLLRNMVFAKHNYAFKSKFLQAYFNLYGFYGGDNSKNRITDISKLLTATDNKNLELIRQAESKQKQGK